jgi:hypothetical protein
MNGRPAENARRFEAQMMSDFERHTKAIKADMHALPEGSMLRRFISQEVDLRERRLRQWKENPSGIIKEPLKEMKDYSRP